MYYGRIQQLSLEHVSLADLEIKTCSLHIIVNFQWGKPRRSAISQGNAKTNTIFSLRGKKDAKAIPLIIDITRVRLSAT